MKSNGQTGYSDHVDIGSADPTGTANPDFFKQNQTPNNIGIKLQQI